MFVFRERWLYIWQNVVKTLIWKPFIIIIIIIMNTFTYILIMLPCILFTISVDSQAAFSSITLYLLMWIFPVKFSRIFQELPRDQAAGCFFTIRSLFVDLNFLWDNNWNISRSASTSSTSQKLISNKDSAYACVYIYTHTDMQMQTDSHTRRGSTKEKKCVWCQMR